MPKPLTVNGNTYNYPKAGEDPNWGAESEGWASEVTLVLGSLVGVGDVLEDSFPIDNSINVPTPISKLDFDSNQVQSVTIDYVVNRTYDVGLVTNGVVESGKLYLVQTQPIANVPQWTLSQTSGGDNSGVSFSVNTNGQLLYQSTPLPVLNYAGKITFTAKVLNI